MTLAKRIKIARERLRPRVSQAVIGDVFGITGQAVSAWETDDPKRGRKPDLEKLPELARRLKVPLSWLLEGTGAPPDPDGIETRLDSLTPDQRATVLAVLDSFQQQRGRLAKAAGK